MKFSALKVEINIFSFIIILFLCFLKIWSYFLFTKYYCDVV